MKLLPSVHTHVNSKRKKITPISIVALQPTDDVVLMARTLEKLFLEKLKDMPVSEVEIDVPTKGKKAKGKAVRGGGTVTRKRTSDLTINQTVSSSNDTPRGNAIPLEEPQSLHAPANDESGTAAPTLTASPIVQINNSHAQVRFPHFLSYNIFYF